MTLPTTPFNKCVRKETGGDEYDNKQSRVYINVGWALPPNAVDILYNDYSNSNPSLPGDIKRIKEAISHANIDLYLNIAGHNITYNQDGTVELSIDYIAAADSLLNDLKANVFYLDPNFKNQAKQFEKNRKYINEKKRSIGKQKCQGATETTLKEAGDELKKEEERKKEAEGRRKYHIYSSVIQHLKKNRQIYLLSVSKEIFVGAGERETTVEEANKKLQDAIGAVVEPRPVAFSVSYNQDNIKEAQPQEKNGRKLIHYFFLGDLINAALGVLYDPELNLANPENFKVIVGPLSYYRRKRIDGAVEVDAIVGKTAG